MNIDTRMRGDPMTENGSVFPSQFLQTVGDTSSDVIFFITVTTYFEYTDFLSWNILPEHFRYDFYILIDAAIIDNEFQMPAKEVLNLPSERSQENENVLQKTTEANSQLTIGNEAKIKQSNIEQNKWYQDEAVRTWIIGHFIFACAGIIFIRTGHFVSGILLMILFLIWWGPDLILRYKNAISRNTEQFPET